MGNSTYADDYETGNTACRDVLRRNGVGYHEYNAVATSYRGNNSSILLTRDAAFGVSFAALSTTLKLACAPSCQRI